VVVALQGEEFSAFGVSSEDGGIHLLEVPAGSAAAQAGFEAGDVVQKIAGKPVKTVDALLEAAGKIEKDAGTQVIDFVRAQASRSLTIQR
jgi:S1-C subfamily serine protease